MPHLTPFIHMSSYQILLEITQHPQCSCPACLQHVQTSAYCFLLLLRCYLKSSSQSLPASLTLATHSSYDLLFSMLLLRSSRPLISAAAGDGSSSEYELAAVYYQVLNRRAADGAAYITVSSLSHYAGSS